MPGKVGKPARRKTGWLRHLALHAIRTFGAQVKHDRAIRYKSRTDGFNGPRFSLAISCHELFGPMVQPGVTADQGWQQIIGK